MAFRIRIEPEARLDIQEGIQWYNKQQTGLGRKFHSQVKLHLKTLEINPFFQIRYRDVHCLPMKKYPFIIHFSVDEAMKTVTVHAVFNTNQLPKN